MNAMQSTFSNNDHHERRRMHKSRLKRHEESKANARAYRLGKGRQTAV